MIQQGRPYRARSNQLPIANNKRRIIGCGFIVLSVPFVERQNIRMQIDYIIVQAGGKGSRLEHLTQNKPKALVPVNNLPMLFHLFQLFPDKKYIIIADYKKDVLRKYLQIFADVKYLIVDSPVENGGTCSGIRSALRYIPEKVPFVLIWSDLILSEDFKLPEESKNYVGISGNFSCRWSYEHSVFTEVASCKNGVAGMFLLKEKYELEDIPDKGEFVRWLQKSGKIFCNLSLSNTKEIGTLTKYETIPIQKCRPFNKIYKEGNILNKYPITDQGRSLAEKECAWYQKAHELGFNGTPVIYSIDPLRMEYINGKNIYEYAFTKEEKRQVLISLVDVLHTLHRLDIIDSDYFSLKENYYTKTIKRLNSIRDLIPLADQRYIKINNRDCRNIFYFRDVFEKRIDSLFCDHFYFIHGDCTFSNLMLKNDIEPIALDPRGYFGFTQYYGDIRYDWAKLYYSIVGNYDQFNLKRFRLNILDDQIQLKIDSNGWEDLEHDFFEITHSNPDEIKLIHAIIWLSLTTYAWEDYDSICAAFYNGLYYLEEVL